MGILIRRRKTETVTITHEFLRISGPQKAMTAWCEQCARETKLMPPEDAAIRMGMSVRAIYRRLEIGDIHFTELPKGSLLICLNSVIEIHETDLVR
jgi:uncharacterized OB-fold protein